MSDQDVLDAWRAVAADPADKHARDRLREILWRTPRLIDDSINVLTASGLMSASVGKVLKEAVAARTSQGAWRPSERVEFLERLRRVFVASCIEGINEARR